MMKARPLAVALLVAFAPATLPVPAFSQTEKEDPVTSVARARFKEGVDFYDKGQYEQARAAFLQAYALKKHPAVLLNLAWSCLKSGHALDAEKFFKQFLAEGKDITDKQRADANDGLSQSRGKIGRIEVMAAPGTEITIDGDRVGAAPLAEPVAVEPGAHTVTFKGTDTATETQSVSVLGGEKAVVRNRKSAPPPAAEQAGGGGGATDRTTAPAASAPAPAETSETPPPSEEAKPASHPRKSHEVSAGASTGPGLLTPPDNLVPVVIGGVLVAASAGVAIAMAIGKSAASDSQNTTAARIQNAGFGCDPVSDPNNGNLVSACASYDSDINNVNMDATIGNIAIGVGAAALAGTIIYWLMADKNGSPSSARTPRYLLPVVAGTRGGGTMGLGARF
jgi:hypothetical protein